MGLAEAEPKETAGAWHRGPTRLLIGAFVLVIAAGGAGDTASPVLVTHSPLLLVALNPRARNVLLASQTVAAVPLLLVALIRRLVLVPVLYRLGRIHGDASLAWVDRRFPRTGRWTRRVERWFGRAAAPVVALLPGGVTAYLAGSTRMHEALVLALSALGTLARLVVLLAVGFALASPLTWLLRFIAAHQMPLLMVSIAISTIYGIHSWRRFRRRDAAPVELIGRAGAQPPSEETPVSAGSSR
jgi:membrane protein DedA with SNARE-associated domain